MGVRPVCRRGEAWEPAVNRIGKAVRGCVIGEDSSGSPWGSLMMRVAWQFCPSEARQVAALQAWAS